MNYTISKTRLKDYFSTITYIDDTFDHCIIDEPIDYGEAEIDEIPPLPLQTPGSSPEDESPAVGPTEEKNMEANLTAILAALNDEKYAGIRFNPVVFNRELNKDFLVNKIQKTPLTLIDWDLGSTDTAFDIINRLFEKTKQLKVIVVYTSNFVEAVKALSEDAKLQNCEEIRTPHINFNCYRCNSQSLLIIAAKQEYNLNAILDVIPDVFINNCGLMSVALLDYMASAQDLTDELFGAFCHPFEDIYWLQMYFSELSEADIPAATATFIQNKICDTCGINPQISDEMFTYHKQRLNSIFEMSDEDAERIVHDAINALRPHLKGANAEFCEALLTVKYAQIKRACALALEESNSWAKLIEIFSSVINEAAAVIVDKKTNSLLEPFTNLSIPEELTEGIDKHKAQVRDSIAKQVAIEQTSFSSEIFPVLVQILMSSPAILFSGVELVRNLKYHNYDNADLGTILAAGKEMNRPEKENYLRNKFHYGDVLIRSKKGSTPEYLLCISPPCDVCRPNKIKLNICFIKGFEIPEKELTVKRKENVHISALPINDKGQEYLKYVAWRLFDVVKFDLAKKDDYEEICSYHRPLLMSEPYSRQIGNLFTAYFSRAGVDELFMKSAQNLRAIFK